MSFILIGKYHLQLLKGIMQWFLRQSTPKQTNPIFHRFGLGYLQAFYVSVPRRHRVIALDSVQKLFYFTKPS